jgi:hypothetical protein
MSRSAMTALAAAIALSSTPLFAQDASVPDPVADTATETPEPATPDPLAPDPAATTAAAPETGTTEAAPASKTSASRAATTARRAASTARSPRSRTADPVRPAQAAQAAAPAVEAPAEIPLPIAEAAPPVAEPAVPPATQAPPIDQANAIDDFAPIAGAAALGLLGLAGAGLAMRRRRRRREDEEFEANQWALNHAAAEPQPAPAMAAPEPVFSRAPVQPTATATALPAGFDISRFGRHVQAAYRGPTPDNPSLSLKNRLRRASFFDQQERRAAEEGKTAAQPAWMTRKANEAEFMFRPATRKPELKPAFQK